MEHSGEHSSPTVERDWRWCSKCACLVYFGWAICPAGQAHDHSQSVDFFLNIDSEKGRKNCWKRCNKCQGLGFAENGQAAPCPHSARHDTSGSVNYALTVDEAKARGQSDWRMCKKCQGLFWSEGSSMGICKAGGTHSHMGSGNYTVSYDRHNALNSESNWRWCRKCRLLCYDGSATCAAGRSHINFGSGFYILPQEHPDALGQDNWRRCKECYGISFAGSPSIGACPATGIHNHSESGNYVLRDDSHAGAQDGWSWCNKCQLLWFSGNGPARCPSGPVAYHDNTGSGNYAIDHPPTVAGIFTRPPRASTLFGTQLNTGGNTSSSQGNPPPPYSTAPLRTSPTRERDPPPSCETQ